MARGGEKNVSRGGGMDLSGGYMVGASASKTGDTAVLKTGVVRRGETDVAGGGEMAVAGGYMLGESAVKIGDRATSKSMKNPPCQMGVVYVTPGTWMLDMSL